MKKQTILSLIAAGAMLFTASAVFAADTKSQMAPLSTALQNLQADGYVAVKEIKLEGESYKAEAINMQGKKVEVKLDSAGKVVEPKSTKPGISMLTAVKKVEEAGYHDIHKVDSEKDKYEVKALDKEGKKVSLEVDALSGDIKK